MQTLELTTGGVRKPIWQFNGRLTGRNEPDEEKDADWDL